MQNDDNKLTTLLKFVRNDVSVTGIFSRSLHRFICDENYGDE